MKQFLIVLVAISALLPVSIEAHGACDKTSAYLGISAHSVSEEKAKKLGFDNPYGSYITKVHQNSAAEKAGLQVFDYIYWVGKYVACHDRSLSTMLSNYETGDEVEVRFVRNGELHSTLVTLGQKSDIQYNNKSCNEKAFLGIDQNWRIQRGLDRGVAVNIVNNSTAEAMGMEDGDVITRINDYPIIDWNDVTTAINDLKVNDNITVEFVRDGQTNRASIPIKSYNETKAWSDDTYASSGGDSYYNHDDDDVYEEEEEENREYGFLGVYTEQVSREKAKKLGFDNPFGSYVTGVISGTAAEKAGVQPFDYIYGVDQYRTGEDQNLTHIFRKYEPNERGTLQLVRDKRKETLSVTFGRRDDVRYEEKSKCEEPFFGIRHDHSRSIKVDGVPVEIVDNSTAKTIGLKDGDIITQINGHYMIDWKDIGIAIDNMTVGKTISVAYLRDGQRMTKQGPIQSYCDTKPEYKQQEQVWNKYKEKNKHDDNDNDDDNKDDNDFFNNELIITKNAYTNSENLDISNITIRISDVNSGEARNLQQRYGHQMGSDLEIDNFKLAKNENQNLFDLTFDLPSRGETIVKIINDDGRVIYEYDLGQFSGDFSDKVDITQNGAGAYYLSIQSGVKTKTKKIVLQKK
jgi:S1-C subfamily serine protease